MLLHETSAAVERCAILSSRTGQKEGRTDKRTYSEWHVKYSVVLRLHERKEVDYRVRGNYKFTVRRRPLLMRKGMGKPVNICCRQSHVAFAFVRVQLSIS